METKYAYRVRFQVYSESLKKKDRTNWYIIELVVLAKDEQAAVMDAAYRAYAQLNGRKQIEMLSCEDVTKEIYK